MKILTVFRFLVLACTTVELANCEVNVLWTEHVMRWSGVVGGANSTSIFRITCYKDRRWLIRCADCVENEKCILTTLERIKQSVAWIDRSTNEDVRAYQFEISMQEGSQWLDLLTASLKLGDAETSGRLNDYIENMNRVFFDDPRVADFLAEFKKSHPDFFWGVIDNESIVSGSDKMGIRIAGNPLVVLQRTSRQNSTNSRTNSGDPSNGKPLPSGNGDLPNKSHAAPRQPAEDPPPAEQGTEQVSGSVVSE